MFTVYQFKTHTQTRRICGFSAGCWDYFITAGFRDIPAGLPSVGGIKAQANPTALTSISLPGQRFCLANRLRPRGRWWEAGSEGLSVFIAVSQHRCASPAQIHYKFALPDHRTHTHIQRNLKFYKQFPKSEKMRRKILQCVSLECVVWRQEDSETEMVRNSEKLSGLLQ